MNESVLRQIQNIAKIYNVEKVILFGSRARKTNHERSDIDIAVAGGDFVKFSLDVEEKVDTLLMFDIVNLSGNVSSELIDEIERDGVIIYEKV